MNGAISVKGYKGDTIKMIARVKTLDKVKQEKQRSESKIKKGDPRNGLTKISNTGLKLEIEKHGNSISIGSMGKKQYLELELKVPFKSNLQLQLHRGGDIIVSDIQGSLDLQNLRGAIKATGIVGPIVAESVRQDVVVVFNRIA